MRTANVCQVLQFDRVKVRLTGETDEMSGSTSLARTVTLPEGSAVNRARMVAVPPSLTARDVFSTSSAAAAGAVSVIVMVTRTVLVIPPPDGVRVTVAVSSSLSLSRTPATVKDCHWFQFAVVKVRWPARE